MSGYTTTDLPVAPLADEVIVNRNGATARQRVADLSTQIAGDGPLAEQLDDLRVLASGEPRQLLPADMATTAAIALTGAQTIDGVATGAGKRVLVKDQADAAQNGVWVTSAGAWTRATDLDAAADFAHASIYVTAGTVNLGTTWMQIASVAEVGSSAVTWRKIKDEAGLQALMDTRLAGKLSNDEFRAQFQITDVGRLALRDPLGFEIATLSAAGLEAHDFALNSLEIRSGPISATVAQGDVVMRDALGFEIVNLSTVSSGSGTAISQPIAERDADNKAASAAIKSKVPPIPFLTAHYMTCLSEGQSFSTGSNAYAVLTTTTALSCFMLGDSVRSSDPLAAGFTPVGGLALQPLVERRQGPSSSGGTVVPIGGGTAIYGETYVSGWLRTLKMRMAATVFASDIPDRQLVGTAVGVGGRTIAQLSKSATPAIYNRGTEAVQAIQSIAAAEGNSHIVAAIHWSQGEADASAARTTYKAALTQYIADRRADYRAITGQTVDPAVYLTPPGAAYTSDSQKLGVQMAMLDVADEVPGVYVVGPYYHYPDPGDHLHANSYRWHGCQIGKVQFITQVLRRGWHPLRPRRATISGSVLTVDFLVPEPPLRWGTAYSGAAAVDFADKGFRLTDDLGEVALTDLTLAADTVVTATLGRSISGTPTLWYGDKSVHNGMGQLFDSDPWQHDFTWQHDLPDVIASENIPALNGKTYSAANACVQFTLTPEMV